MGYLPGWIGIIVGVYAIVMIILIIADDRDPQATITWMFLLIVLPGVGLLLYLLLGRDLAKVAGKRAEVKEFLKLASDKMQEYNAPYADVDRRLAERAAGTVSGRLIKSIGAANRGLTVPLPVREVEIFPTGAESFDRLIADMSRATKFVHMQYFIWEHDELTERIMKVLLDRLGEGVEVRITYDWLGSIPFKKDELKRLEAAGAKQTADVTGFTHLNYRNHRKMTIIDNEIGYTGGINIGQEYIDGGEKYPVWRDTMIRFTGPAVAQLELWFSARWYEIYKEDLLVDKYLPAHDPALQSGDPVMLQIVVQGVEDPWMSSTRAYQIAIAGAKHDVKLSSPYFIPDAGTYDALIDAALGGVDVKFIMTGWPDHKMAFYAAQTYWPKLIQAGGHVYMYMAGFYHSKTLTIDGEACAVGTMNMDIRSLKLHKEMMAWVYDPDVTRHQEEIFAADLELSKEVTMDDIGAFSTMTRFRNSAYRLMSNTM